MKKIKIMADYHCYPLWHISTSKLENLNPNDLPISSALCLRLMRWAEIYDTTLNMKSPIDFGFSSEVEKASL